MPQTVKKSCPQTSAFSSKMKVIVVVLLLGLVQAGSKKKAKDYFRSRRGACADTEFQCKDGDCIQEEWTCDSQSDCWDNSDETLSECPPLGYCTGAHMVYCKNVRCVPLEYRCDGNNDCGDGTDEADCASFTCSRGEFKCSNGHCVEEIYLCDGDDDCGDSSDEKASNCPSGKRGIS